MKSISDDKPKIFEKVGDGSWWYRFNVQMVTVEDPETGEARTEWHYDECRIFEQPNENNVKAAAIAEVYTVGEEINLQNNFQRFQLGLSKDESFRTKYIEYLQTVDAIKDQVERDLVEYAGDITV